MLADGLIVFLLNELLVGLEVLHLLVRPRAVLP